ncbi:survival motor neuron-like protein 1 [Cladorrhinum sp. PSN332]|nr:survival motor neuron-like protein 1 [Cladorrhinum sp. PSN332]
MESEENLTHEEVWDDSALVDSWNQALEEYKKYHSIHAKGGTIDDLLEAQEREVTLPDAKQETNGVGEEHEAEHEDESEPMDESDETSNPTTSDTQQSAEKKVDEGGSVAGGWPATTGHGPGPGPQVLLGSVQDEDLKKLLMSWYYAGRVNPLFISPCFFCYPVADVSGYHTGLYEGKQKGLQEAEQARKT